MNIKLVILLISFLLISCNKTSVPTNLISDVYVEDFSSDDMEHCRPSNVDLNNHEAEDYFNRAKKVDYSVIHDHYNIAPCFIEGTLKYSNNICEWQIRAGATGYIKCGEDTQYYACDICDGLFNKVDTPSQ